LIKAAFCQENGKCGGKAGKSQVEWHRMESSRVELNRIEWSQVESSSNAIRQSAGRLDTRTDLRHRRIYGGDLRISYGTRQTSVDGFSTVIFRRILNCP